MMQLQYLHSGLKNNHINKILNNYKIKYTQIKNEIESKINQIIKFFLNDILVFLENIEEVSEQKHKINEYDSILKELEITKAKIKDKITSEHKLKNEYDMLQQENYLLKLKINSLNTKIKNMNNEYNINSQTISPLKDRRRKDYLSPRVETATNKYSESLTDNIISYSKSGIFSPSKSEFNKTIKQKENIDKLTLKLNYDKMIKAKNKFYNKNKKTNIKKYINNGITIKPIKNINSKKFNFKKEDNKKNNSIISQLNKKKGKLNSSAEKINYNNKINHYSPMNTINQINDITSTKSDILDYEYIGQNINDAINSEVKELEQDEENIESLLEQLDEYIDNFI